jgi:hypothetical protein
MGIVRELHVHDHYNGMIALLFAYEDGTVEAFDIHGLPSLGRFTSVAAAAVEACGNALLSPRDS